MRYVCLVHVDRSAMAALSEDERTRLTDASIDFDWELRNNGQLLIAQPLQPAEKAVVVRVRGGRMSSTDGPYAETKELLGGFFLIEASDLDEAVEVAGRSPMAAMGSIEVRPVLEQTHSVTGKRRPDLSAD